MKAASGVTAPSLPNELIALIIGRCLTDEASKSKDWLLPFGLKYIEAAQSLALVNRFALTIVRKDLRQHFDDLVKTGRHEENLCAVLCRILEDMRHVSQPYKKAERMLKAFDSVVAVGQ